MFYLTMVGTALILEGNKNEALAEKLDDVLKNYQNIHSTTVDPNPLPAKGIYQISKLFVSGGTGGAGGYYSTSYYDIATHKLLGEIHGNF